MKIYRYLLVLTVLALSAILTFSSYASRASMQGTTGVSAAREDAYRANNLGVALLEQFKYQEAADAFRRALKVDPQLAIARINLAIALYNLPDMVGALREAKATADAMPKAPQSHYMLGKIAKDQNRLDDAAIAFQRVIALDPRDTGGNILLGQVYVQQRKYPEAIALFRIAYDAEPYNGTALYSLGTALLRGGDREEGQRLIQRFKELRESGAATSIGNNYLEQGRYAEGITSTGAEPDLVDKQTPDVTFADATAGMMPNAAADVAAGTNSSGGGLGQTIKGADFNDAAKNNLVASLGGGTTLFDFDNDGDLDLFEVSASAQKLYRNDTGKFVEVTAQSGAFSKETGGIGIGAVAGDFDNDEKPDLFVLRYGANALYRNEGNGRFVDVTATAKLAAYPHLSISAAFVDADHDGDLDIFIAGLADLAKPPQVGANGASSFPKDFAGAPHMLLRNNGNGTFVDYTASAKVTGSADNHAVAVVPTDYDNRRDVDLLVVNFSAPPALHRNLRDGTFRDVAAEVGIDVKGRDWNFTSAAAGDVNKDGYTDFYFGELSNAGVFAMSDGQGRFRIAENTPRAASPTLRNQAAQFLDYDNDGLLDLVTMQGDGVYVWRNIGSGWQKIIQAADANAATPLWKIDTARAFASGDVDGDGDVDLVTRSVSGRTIIGRNEGGNRNRSVRVRLAGKVSNRSGVASKIEARAGSLQQKLETYSATPAPAPADIVFGLGQRTQTDAVRVIWPAGIVQAETEITPPPATARAGDMKPAPPPNAPSLTVIELDRKPSSCPYLFAWNGDRFEFITDFMGGGELGYWVAPGVRAMPDPDEYVRIRGDQLKPRDGRYEIRVTNELEEALFMDRLQLVAVAHPAGVEVYPNEGLGNPTSSTFNLYATRDARLPVSAIDDKGQDVLDRIQQVDRKYPDNFRLHRIRGYADEHTLTLDLGKTGDGRPLLLMTGWTDYAFSSDNVAAAQGGLSLALPKLQVKDEQGNWKTVIEDIGVPVGRPQTVTVDLTGKFLSNSREVRIVTNMRIYWDQILVDTSDGKFATKLTRLEPTVANLRWRGFSAEATPDGREPYGYTYERVSSTSPWKTFPGRYTREGDVRELLGSVDDMFVISRPGDEISIAFDESQLPKLPDGWTRTFLLYAEGYSKEMDINSASPDQVAPLPFKGMKSYPYSSPESYPMTPAHHAYIERYNTRIVKAPVSALAGALDDCLEAGCARRFSTR
ncbi:MAG: FG-GAP-like repeat-containing protein [Acidobacteriota bacterium]|nr:FG-GAP-like repeat-containing protein [Acidobacteriota bacterium]